MLKGFICPDKQVIDTKDCYQGCRLGTRCMALPVLKLIGTNREWKGVASTTQLLNGTMYSWLTLTHNFAVDPDSRMFALHGTIVHKQIEIAAKELGLTSEKALSIDRDIMDLLDVDNQGLGLVDFKTWGSYRVAKALGIVEIGKKPDPSGEVYKSSGKWGKAGSPKMIPDFGIDEGKIDNMEATLQLNNYRVIFEEQTGDKLAWMRLQVIVRDGGTYLASGRGITRNSYLIEVPFLDDDMVRGYFKMKADQLNEALEHGWTEPCTPSERWDDQRCKGYCEVWQWCPQGRLVKEIK